MIDKILKAFWYIKTSDDSSYFWKYNRLFNKVDLLETQNAELLKKVWSDVSNPEYINSVISMNELQVFLEKQNIKPVYNILEVIRKKITIDFNRPDLTANDAAYRSWALDIINEFQTQLAQAQDSMEKIDPEEFDD